ncbi:LYR motif-containing protein 4 isoform X4 [Vidua macroura]|uniref:LYR motif-containing protein 4 isoform X4 n=1 Tax=Vidua macroura TaxID=187451 RepID=UPI0023A86156|nr:LYR motif-containing protein 4 isoform X4 [Vidua macroura]
MSHLKGKVIKCYAKNDRGQKVLPSLITYAIKRIRDAFRENKNIADSEKIEELLNKAKANLEVIQRQVTIDQLYATEKLVIESPGNT